MLKHSPQKAVHRIIDANINRVKEGLRVLEEITRFILQNRQLTAGLKIIRHNIDTVSKRLAPRQQLLKGRNSVTDLGREIFGRELHRKNFQDIFAANIQRVKESIRVLEEFSKLKDTRIAKDYKRIRYRIYEIEKKAVLKLYHK